MFYRLRREGQNPVAGVYLPEGRHPIIPFFQHSIIPIVFFYFTCPFSNVLPELRFPLTNVK
jgi:hypothetical protein